MTAAPDRDDRPEQAAGERRGEDLHARRGAGRSRSSTRRRSRRRTSRQRRGVASTRGRGGTGRRAGFRSRWASALGGSIPLARIETGPAGSGQEVDVLGDAACAPSRAARSTGRPRWISATNSSSSARPTAARPPGSRAAPASASTRRGRGRGRRAGRCRRRTRSRGRPRGSGSRRRSAGRSRRRASARGRASRPRSRAPAATSRSNVSGPSTRKRHGSVRWWFGAQRASSRSSSIVSRSTGSGSKALCVRRVRIAASRSIARTLASRERPTASGRPLRSDSMARLWRPRSSSSTAIASA